MLGVPRTATKAEVKARYYELAKALHPDANPGDPGAAARFHELSTAYRTLSDDARRRAYDSGSGSGSDSSSASSSEGGAGDAGGAFSVFEQMLRPGGFGDMLGLGGVFRAVGSAFGVSAASQSQTQQTQQQTATLEVDFMEAVRGGRRNVRVSVPTPCDACGGTGSKVSAAAAPPCRACGGSGAVAGAGLLAACKACGGSGTAPARAARCGACRGAGSVRAERTAEVDVPFGAVDGEVLQARAVGGTVPVPVLIRLHVRPHPLLRREGTDVHVDAPLTTVQAALGTKLRVPAVDSARDDATVSVHAPPGTQPGDVLLLRGRGVRRLGSVKRGNLVVHWKVVVPRSLSPAADALLRKYAEEEARFAPQTRWWADAFKAFNEATTTKKKKATK